MFLRGGNRWMRYFLWLMGVLVAVVLLLLAALATVPRGPLPTVPADRPLTPIAWKSTVTVLAFGTSLTEREGWVKALQERLADCDAPGFIVSRLSLPGANIDWALEQVEAVNALAPDVVLMEFATNDADILDGLTLQQARRTTLATIEALRFSAPRRQIVLMTMNPVIGWADTAQRPMLAQHFQQYREIAAEAETGLLDFAARWAEAGHPGDGTRKLIPDGLHPTPEAASGYMVDTIAKYLRDATGEAGC